MQSKFPGKTGIVGNVGDEQLPKSNHLNFPVAAAVSRAVICLCTGATPTSPLWLRTQIIRRVYGEWGPSVLESDTQQASLFPTHCLLATFSSVWDFGSDGHLLVLVSFC